jgi:Domain of unknown function (DUF1844)
MNPHFASLVMGLAAQAGAALEGQLPLGADGAGVDPREVARTLIDTLGMLEEKTTGRLDDEEKKLLMEVLTSLRFRFLQTTPQAT